MTYTKVVLNTSTNVQLPFNLNRVDRGWVAQILNGTFGSNREYNFTGNTVTSMSEKQIDINMRLTPAVPIPERSARYFLDYLSSPRIHTIELTDPDMVVPVVRYTKTRRLRILSRPSRIVRQIHSSRTVLFENLNTTIVNRQQPSNLPFRQSCQSCMATRSRCIWVSET